MDSIEEMNEIMADRIQDMAPISANAQTLIDSQFVGDCLRANELGDALMYIALNRGKRLYNQTTAEWMRWAGNHWEIDRGSADAMSAMEGVVMEYQKEAKSLVDRITNETNTEAKTKLINIQKGIYRRIERLRSVRGCNNCLTFTTRCYDRLVVTSDEFDKYPMLMPVKNGVVDLQTGDLMPGNPADLLMNACPHEWADIGTPCPTWDQTLFEIMSDNHEMVDFCQRLFGYSITGLTNEHILPVFYGKGRNGKTLLVETIRYCMGPMASPIKAEMLLDQTFMKSSSGPSPDIMALKGLRMAFASETDAGRKISPSQVKLLTGGDTLVGRNPHDKYETRFEPSHTLYLMTNNKPRTPSDEYALWKRLILVPFLVSFVDDPVDEDERAIDKDLQSKLKSEASGILAWLVRGCLEWQRKGGLELPVLVCQATEGYRRDEDIVLNFIDACCDTGPEYRISSSNLYDAFKNWYSENVSKKSIPSHKTFSTSIKLKFNWKKYGVVYILGIRIRPETDAESEFPEDMGYPS